MSKKTFKGGLDSLLQTTSSNQKATTTSTISTTLDINKPDETRATFIVREDYLDQIKAVAYWERLLVKDVVNNALADYLTKYGNVKPIPNKSIN
ncbi:MAG: hypothetical protein SFY32_08055 [Bacteroidota bacterium]|nr:hypothetical protein [Bacteroidota bacterium]